ncbi:efflux RND transporter periplasmic adaptor subunit [Candidatus Pelagibacter sp.]|nr:efflux RND transporter periplasmic adaptor subunit [Candidatus Pelagibacter sp.]|tara:strand:+ start:1200 stop:2069 length:870 start_codon:yes stop_codon:yes gene_type:complete
MKRSTKITTIIIIFFLIIASVIIGRTMIGNHFKKKFSKRPPPSIIVSEVIKNEFSDNIESFGTAISKKNKTFRIEKSNLISDLNLKKFVKEGEIIVKLKSENIIAPFSGILGVRGITEDVLGSENSIIVTLDDSSEIYVDLKIPENFATVIKKDLSVIAKFSGIKDKIYKGKIDGVASRINAETRSILTRVKIDNPNYELIPGSLLEITLSTNKRDSLSIPDTSIILEGNKAYVYKVSKDNIANRSEIQIGLRNDGKVEVTSGLNAGDIIVAEGLKKVRPNGKIKPLNK